MSKIKYYRLLKNMTQKDLSIKTGLSRETIGNYERGDRLPNIEVIVKIVAALDMTLSEFMDENTIKFKNIDLSSISIEDQVKKVEEEDQEFIEAIFSGSKDHALEELCDKFQAALGLAEKVRGITAAEVMEYWPKHMDKLKNRPR